MSGFENWDLGMIHALTLKSTHHSTYTHARSSLVTRHSLLFPHPHRPNHRFSSVPYPHPVNLLVETHHFGRVLEQVQLGRSLYQVAEFHPDEPDQHSSLVKSYKQRFGQLNEFVVERGVRNALLQGVGVKIRIAYLHRDA